MVHSYNAVYKHAISFKTVEKILFDLFLLLHVPTHNLVTSDDASELCSTRDTVTKFTALLTHIILYFTRLSHPIWPFIILCMYLSDAVIIMASCTSYSVKVANITIIYAMAQIFNIQIFFINIQIPNIWIP